MLRLELSNFNNLLSMTHTLDPTNNETSTNFALQIEKILEKRQAIAERISTTKSNLNQLLNCLTAIINQQSDLVSGLKDRHELAKIQNVDFQELIVKLKQEQIQLQKLESRFSRTTLNIAVVGIAGQGKSRLLQTLTGLSCEIIPDGKDGDCTAVRSNIYHRPELDNTVNIQVKYHDRDSFLQNVILPYYEELKINPQPRSLDEFSTAQLTENLSMNQVDLDKYAHLKNYQAKLTYYRHLLQQDNRQEQKINVSKAELRSYVTQDEVGDNKSFDYLAVKEVDIFCSFPKSDLGKIAFVDLPGLGDSKINNYQNLLRTLSEDVDFVLFMRMPGAIYRQTNDLDSTFYDLADSAIANLPIKQWSFYVINYYPQLGNELGCKKFKTKIQQKNIVADTAIADCANTQEVTQNILAPVLNYLTNNLNNLDQQYAEKSQQELIKIQSQVEEKLQRVSIYTQEATTRNFGDLTTRYTNLFNELYEELHTKLTQEAKAMSHDNKSDNTELAEFIQQAIENSNAELKVASVEKLAEQVQKLSFAEVFPQQLRILHANIHKPFNQVDDCLHESLETAKGKIVEILITQGRLDKIIFQHSRPNKNELKSANEFFDRLLKAIPEHLEVEKLKSAITNIKNATLSYEAEIKEILDRHKEHLDPDRTKYQLNNQSKNRFQLLKKEAKITPETLRQTLIKAQTAVINDSKQKLLKLSADPNKKLANIIETFVEEAFLDDENGKVKDDWRKFLSYYTAEIWLEEFGSDANELALKKEWMQLVEDAKNANSSNLLNFI